MKTMKTIRGIRSLCCETCPIIPGRPGPVEPFNPRCLGDDPATWAAIDRYMETAFRWDTGAAGVAVDEGAAEDAVSLAHWYLLTTPPEVWQRLGIGYGDRWRAIVAVRFRLKRMGWQDRQSATGHGRQARRRGRSYVQSMSLRTEDPARIVSAAEQAEREGVTGKPLGRGPRRDETRIVAAETALRAIQGEPMREVVIGPVWVDGGTAHVENDGTMREVVVKDTAFTFHTGSRGPDGRWVPDGGVENLAEIETRWAMVRGTSRAEYPRCPVAEAVDIGTERDKFIPAPTPAPEPWTDEERAAIVTRRGGSAEWVEVLPDRPSRARHWLRAD